MISPREQSAHPGDRPGGQSAGDSGVYELTQPPPAAPPLPGRVSVAQNLDALIDIIAADLVIHAENCVRQFGDFHLALSGAASHEPLYDRLMYDPSYRRLPWRRTQLWIVDDCCVPFDDACSKFALIRATIVEHSDIPPAQVHPILSTAEDAADQYAEKLREALGWREKGQDRLDYVLLGVGADGHTAGLFPNGSALEENECLVTRVVDAATEPAQRITMTLKLINAARFIGVIATGAELAELIGRLVAGRDSVRELPIKGVAPLEGELKWYLDAAACRSVTK